MNEQIKELALQAGFQLGYYNDTWFLGGLNPSCDEELKKFAELIVKECARVAAQTPCPYTDDFARQTYGHTWDMACVESAKDIRKHFGIKE